MDEQPIQMVAKISKWGKKAGGFINAQGQKMVKIRRGGPGKNKNSGPVGKRRQRFYQGAYGTRPTVNRKAVTPRQVLDNVKAASQVK